MRCWLTGILLFLATGLHAQDLHFTQVAAQPLWLNPALTGDFFGHVRGGLTFRDQWASVPVPWRTFTLGADTRLALPFAGGRQLGLGILLGSDQAGELDYGQTSVRLATALPLAEGSHYALRAGMAVGVLQQRFDPARLQMPAQFDGDLFDPDLPTGESWQATSISGLEWHGGVWLRLSPNDALHLSGGLFAARMRFARRYLGAQAFRRPWRTGVHLHPTWTLTPSLDLQANLLAQWQGPYREMIVGLLARYWLMRNPAAPVQAGAGFYFRKGDAFAPAFELQWHAWEAGFSYDLHLSPFRSATHARGGPEWFLRYTLRLVGPPPAYRGCPLF